MRSLRDMAATVCGLGDVATREQLQRAGFTPTQISSAVKSGLVIRLRRAWYALPEVDVDRATAIMLGGRLGCLSSAASYGWWRGLDTRTHVSWPVNGNIAKPGREKFGSDERPDLVHHWRTLSEPDDRRNAWRESPAQTISQVFRSCDKQTAIACGDAALHSGLVSAGHVRRILAELCLERRQWGEYLDYRTDSGLESIVRIWLIDRGIPFSFHPVVSGIGEVDFIIGRSLVIETDGSEFHTTPEDVKRDARRDHELSLRGYIVIRLRYAWIMYDWPACVARILNHLGRGDHLRHLVG